MISGSWRTHECLCFFSLQLYFTVFMYVAKNYKFYSYWTDAAELMVRLKINPIQRQNYIKLQSLGNSKRSLLSVIFQRRLCLWDNIEKSVFYVDSCDSGPFKRSLNFCCSCLSGETKLLIISLCGRSSLDLCAILLMSVLQAQLQT